MGQTYHLTEDQDELLSEAEKAFDLSARRQSIGWPQPQGETTETGIARFPFLSGWLRRQDMSNKAEA